MSAKRLVARCILGSVLGFIFIGLPLLVSGWHGLLCVAGLVAFGTILTWAIDNSGPDPWE